MNAKDDHIKKAFAEESLEHLSSIEEDLIRIEKGDTGPDRERVNKVFRAVHSIKGGSGFLGIQNITRLAHAMETVLGLIREGTLDPNAEVTHFLLKASDALTHMIQYLDHSDKIDISETVTALENISAGSRKNTNIPSPEPNPNPDAFADVALDSDPGVQPDTETAHDNDPITISARDGSPVFVLEKSDYRRLENENKLVFFVEIPLETIDVPGEKYLETISSQIKAYGTMLVYRIEKNMSR